MCTVKPALKDHPNGHKNMVSQDRWSLVTGSVTLKCGTFCKGYVVLQDRLSLMVVVSQERFHCTEVLPFLLGTPFLSASLLPAFSTHSRVKN